MADVSPDPTFPREDEEGDVPPSPGGDDPEQVEATLKFAK